VSLLHVMVMDSLMFGTSIKTLRVLSAIQTHLKINKEKMDINYKKKEKPFLHLNGQEMEEELLLVIQKVS
jgi:hypothetical protein